MSFETLFNLTNEELIGTVFKVDSYSVAINVQDQQVLEKVSVNGFVLLHTADPNTRLVGRIDRVLQTEVEFRDDDFDKLAVHMPTSHSVVNIVALGTLKGTGGGRRSPSFTRAVEKLPEIGANCYLLLAKNLTKLTSLIAQETSQNGQPLTLGTYTLADDAVALLDGNAFFQRHAMVVGSTGSGKSWTVATIVGQVANLPSANMILFDLHGEYAPLAGHANIQKYRIAGPGDLENPGEDVLFLPYWLLGYEDMLALILDRSDENAPNQAMAFSNAVISAKKETLERLQMNEELETFTIDSPVPFEMSFIIDQLNYLNTEKVINPSTNRENNGPFHGKFNRFLPRLNSKISDRRHGFLFHLKDDFIKPNYLDHLVHALLRTDKGVKIIDFSEVPSDILPLVISLVAKLTFQIQQWSLNEERHPVALVCDEAHLYIPSKEKADASQLRALAHFERIAKEGRKYGVSLLIVSQRPSELNKTIISQCNNVVSLRLSNQSDKSAVTSLLPENLGGIQDMLPTLGIGEAIVVGDACLLPSRIKIMEPEIKPNSDSVKFWSRWNDQKVTQNLVKAVNNLRKQTTRS